MQYQIPCISTDILDEKENIYEDDESNWLHRNDAYQMQRISRQMTHKCQTVCEPPTQYNGQPTYPRRVLKKRLVHRFFNGAKLSKVFISSFFGHSIVDSGTEHFYGIKQHLPIQHNNDHSHIQ